jgi:hypothetical protein
MTIRPRTCGPVLAVLLGLALTGCGGTADPAPASSGTAGPPPTSGPAAAGVLTLDITVAGGRVTPNGQKIDARVGQRVVENVTSDVDDEIHAHTGGDGYELEVKAGTPATGGFTLTTPGSFEVESHGTGKIIAILNVR